MSDTNKPNSNLETKRDAYQQIYRGSAALLDMNSLSWIERLLLGQVNALSKRRLDQSGEGISHENNIIYRDRIEIGNISGSQNIAIGSGVTVGITQDKDPRDEQYEIVKHWDGKRLLRGYDLSERDLSGLNLANADLRKANLNAADLSNANLVKANLSEADLSDTNLTEADLSEASLNGAKYTANTTWPDGFVPEEAGAVPVEGKESS